MPTHPLSLRALLASLGLSAGVGGACSAPSVNAGIDAGGPDAHKTPIVDAAVRDAAWIPRDAADPPDVSDDAPSNGSDQ